MATALKLKNDINKLKAALRSKATPKSFLPKLKSQLEKAEADYESVKAGKKSAPKASKQVKSTMDKLKAIIKKKKYGAYRAQGVDLKKDADIPALPTGKRISKSGNTYYEYRANRIDVKQPPKRYPKLEDGGETSTKKFNTKYNVGKAKYVINYHDGKKTHKDGSPFYDLATFKNMKDFMAYKKKLKYEGYKEYKDGGMMADGGKLDSGVYRVGKPTKVSPMLYEQKIVEIFDNGDIATASDYGRKLTDFKVQSYPIITTEQLEAQYKMEKGGYMAKGGETVPYIIWVSKDGEKRELYGTYKSQRAADMAMRKLWDSSDYMSMGNKPKKMYEKEGFYADGGMMAKGGKMDDKISKVVMAIRKSKIHPDDVSPNFVNLIANEIGINLSSKEVVDISDNYGEKYASGGMMADGGMIKVEEDAYGKSAYIPYKGETFLLEWNAERPTKASTVISDRSFRRLDEDSSLYQHLLVTLLKAMHENKVQYAEEGAKMASGGYMADGGKIENNYRGLSDSELWDKWSTRQKIHFLEDHRDKYSDNDVLTKYTNIELSNMSFDKLPSVLQSMVYEHRIDGQYASGGYMADGGMMADGGEVKGSSILQALNGYNSGLTKSGIAENLGLSNYRFGKYASESQMNSIETELKNLIKLGYVEEGGVGYKITQEGAKHLDTIPYEKREKGGYMAKGGGMMAKGGLTDHGLKIGDKITSKFDNVVVVENDGKTFVVNLNMGKRWSDNAWFSLNHGNTAKYSKMADGGHVMSTTHRMSK